MAKSLEPAPSQFGIRALAPELVITVTDDKPAAGFGDTAHLAKLALIVVAHHMA